MQLPVFSVQARGILSATSGFIRQAGFTHSLTPARNCTFGCTYCYVPTMGIYGGLKPDDWQRWGQFTTFKRNAAELLRRELRENQIIYCSPLTDPYQPAEQSERQMPAILETLIERPPRRFVLQTRGPLILQDLPQLVRLAQVSQLRVSFSLTTNREEVRRAYEPHCAPYAERLEVIRKLAASGIAVHATLAPLLPCEPEVLIRDACQATTTALIADPAHNRVTKKHGATTREAALHIAAHRNEGQWFESGFQSELTARMAALANTAGRAFGVGPEGFRVLATG